MINCSTLFKDLSAVHKHGYAARNFAHLSVVSSRQRIVYVSMIGEDVENAKAAEEAKKAEAESVVKKLLAGGMSADEILEKLK